MPKSALGMLLGFLLGQLCMQMPAQGWEEIPNSAFCNPINSAYTHAFDSARGRWVCAALNAATAEFDGTSWACLPPLTFPAPPPPSPLVSNLVFDPVTQRVTCIIGSASTTSPNYWLSSWDGNAWSHRSMPTFLPMLTNAYSLSFDPRNQRLFAFSEQGNTYFYIDSTQLVPMATVAGTLTVGGSLLANFIDPSTQAPSIVTFVGGLGVAYNAALSWTGTNWAQSFPSWPYFMTTGSIVGRSHFTSCTLSSGAMAFHYTVDQATGSLRPRTTRLSNGIATEQFLTSYPPSVVTGQNYLSTWDPQRNCFYSFTIGFGNTWRLTLGPEAQASTLGTGCTGSRGMPTLAPQQGSTPRIGTTFVLQSLNLPLSGPVFLALGASDTLYGPTPLPLNLAPLGAPQCNLLVSIDNLFSTSNILGAATWGFTIPNIPGGVFFTQTVVFDPPANAFGVTLSNAVRGVVGS